MKEYCWTDQQRQKFIDTYGGGYGNAVHHPALLKVWVEMKYRNNCGETTMNPENRMLKQVHLENAAEADYTFSMLMGEDVRPAPRFHTKRTQPMTNIDA